MSLMNDALRKKKRELTASPPATGFRGADHHPRKVRTRVVVAAALLLLLGSVVLGGGYLQQSPDTRSLLVKQPLPAATRQPLVAAAAENATTEPSAEDGSIQATVSDPIPAAASLVSHAPVPVPSAPALALNVPPTMTRLSENAGRPAEEKTTEQEGAPVTKRDNAQSEPSRRVSRAFEPGPDPAVKREPPAAAVSQRYRSSALSAPVVPARAATPKNGDHGSASTDEAEPNLFYQKALACHRSGRLAEAARLYRQVLRIDAGHAEAMLNLAAVYIEEGQFGQAQPLLNHLEQVSPRPEGVLLNLAITAIGRDAPEKALAYLDRAEAQADASPWEIRFHRAAALSRMNRLSESLPLYRQVAGERPDDSRVQFNLAVTCDSLGLYPEALAYYEAALQTPRQSPESDDQAVIARMASIRRYLDTTQSPVKGQ